MSRVELEGYFEGTWYRWSCGNCQSVNETENDPRNDSVTCTECGAVQIVVGNI